MTVCITQLLFIAVAERFRDRMSSMIVLTDSVKVLKDDSAADLQTTYCHHADNSPITLAYSYHCISRCLGLRPAMLFNKRILIDRLVSQVYCCGSALYRSDAVSGDLR